MSCATTVAMTVASRGGERAAAARAVRNDLDLVVVRASDVENTAHEAMLDKLREQGDCVWDRLNDNSQAAK